MIKNKVLHVEKKNTQPDEIKHFYFGSKAAIFEMFTEEELGASLPDLWQHDFEEKPYENKNFIIRLGSLSRKKGNRGKKQ